MTIYEHISYKMALRERVASLRKGARPVTLKQIAKRLGIQYTYLSRVLNDPGTHLSADRLYKFCVTLELSRPETDYLLLLRDYESSEDPEWKEHLLRRVEEARTTKRRDAEMVKFAESRLHAETTYLFDPLALVVQVAFFIPQYKKEPRLLCAPLGITPKRLKKILAALADVGHLELTEDGAGVKRLLKQHVYYGREHPLMRAHQGLFKTMIQSQLMRLPEEDKHSLLLTFNMDQKSFAAAKERLQKLVGEIDEIAKKSKDEGVYQLSLDLFRWL